MSKTEKHNAIAKIRHRRERRLRAIFNGNFKVVAPGYRLEDKEMDKGEIRSFLTAYPFN